MTIFINHTAGRPGCYSAADPKGIQPTFLQGLKQLAAQKPPTKESTQVKELVAAYEAELAVMVGGARLQVCRHTAICDWLMHYRLPSYCS